MFFVLLVVRLSEALVECLTQCFAMFGCRGCNRVHEFVRAFVRLWCALTYAHVVCVLTAP